jgi:hypothetical protein
MNEGSRLVAADPTFLTPGGALAFPGPLRETQSTPSRSVPLTPNTLQDELRSPMTVGQGTQRGMASSTSRPEFSLPPLPAHLQSVASSSSSAAGGMEGEHRHANPAHAKFCYICLRRSMAKSGDKDGDKSPTGAGEGGPGGATNRGGALESGESIADALRRELMDPEEKLKELIKGELHESSTDCLCS